MTEDTQLSWEQKLIETALLAQTKEQSRKRRWGIFFKLFFMGLIVFSIVMGVKNVKPRGIVKEAHTALIDINGVIGERNGVTADDVAGGLRHAFEAEQSKGIILRINSPGGSPVQSAYVYDEIMRLKALYPEKKVYAVISDVGASGAYFIAAAADEIYANASSIVGSIGVLMPNFGVQEAAEKLGIEQRSLHAGVNKMFLDPLSPKDDKQIEFANKLLANVHTHFIKAVKDGRGDRLKQNDEIFSGLFWSGDQAMALGLVDGLGSTGYVAREIIKQEDIIDYTISDNLLDRLASRFGSSLGTGISSRLGLGPVPMQLN